MWTKLLWLRLWFRDLFNPLSMARRDDLSSRLDYLIFEALSSASITLDKSRLVDINTSCLSVISRHEEIAFSYPSFFDKNRDTFRLISNLADGLHLECLSLVRQEEHRWGDSLEGHFRLKIIRSYCHDLYDLYFILWDGHALSSDCVHLMFGDKRRFYLTKFIYLRKDILLQSG